MVQQHVVAFSKPADKKFFSSDFRSTVGSIHNGSLPLAFFNKNENADHLRSKPQHFFSSSRHQVSFVSESPTAQQDVIQFMPFGLQAIQKHFGEHNATIKTSIVEKSGIPTYAPVKYRLIEGVRRTDKLHFSKTTSDEKALHIINSMLNNAYAQGAIHDLPPESKLNLKILSSSELGFRPIEKSRHFSSLVKAEFIMNMELTGHWFAGSFTNRGYGRVIKSFSFGGENK